MAEEETSLTSPPGAEDFTSQPLTLLGLIESSRTKGIQTYTGPTIRNGWEFIPIDSPRELQMWLMCIQAFEADGNITVDVLDTKEVIVVWNPDAFPSANNKK